MVFHLSTPVNVLTLGNVSKLRLLPFGEGTREHLLFAEPGFAQKLSCRPCLEQLLVEVSKALGSHCHCHCCSKALLVAANDTCMSLTE